MAFKMKGPALLKTGNENMADGRSKSAVFQMKSPMKQDFSEGSAWNKFMNETKTEDFLNEDGSFNAEAHKKAIDDSMIRNGLKPKPEGWVGPLATKVIKPPIPEVQPAANKPTRLPEVDPSPKATKE